MNSADNDPVFQKLLQIVEIGACTFNGMEMSRQRLSLRALNKLARCCRQFYQKIRPGLMRSQKIFEKWSPLMRTALNKKILKHSVNHPIEYDSSTTITATLDNFGVNEQNGLAVTDNPNIILFNINESTMSAFYDVSFITRKPVSFMYELNINGICLHRGFVDAINYVELSISPDQKQNLIDVFGDVERTREKQYYCCLRLPTRFNPLLLGRLFIPASHIFIKISSLSYHVLRGASEINHDIYLMINLITHVIVQLKTADRNKYKWSDYIASFSQKHGAISTESIIKLDDGNQTRLCMDIYKDIKPIILEDLEPNEQYPYQEMIAGIPDNLTADGLLGDEDDHPEAGDINLWRGIRGRPIAPMPPDEMDRQMMEVWMGAEIADVDEMDRRMLEAWMDNIDPGPKNK